MNSKALFLLALFFLIFLSSSAETSKNQHNLEGGEERQQQGGDMKVKCQGQCCEYEDTGRGWICVRCCRTAEEPARIIKNQQFPEIINKEEEPTNMVNDRDSGWARYHADGGGRKRYVDAAEETKQQDGNMKATCDGRCCKFVDTGRGWFCVRCCGTAEEANSQMQNQQIPVNKEEESTTVSDDKQSSGGRHHCGGDSKKCSGKEKGSEVKP